MQSFRPKLLSVAIANVLCVSMAGAAVINVTTNADDGEGSLRQAIENAAVGDTIDLSGVPGGSIALESALILNKNLHLYAPLSEAGEPSVTLTLAGQASNARLLSIAPANNGADPLRVILQGLNFTGGRSEEDGGAINADRTALMVANSTITGNTAVGAGGGIAARDSEVCLTASAVEDNEVVARREGGKGNDPYSASASGGGLAVVGALELLGAKYDSPTPTCFDGDGSRSFFEEFEDFDPTSVATKNVSITGNRAIADDSEFVSVSDTPPFESPPLYLAALGGGIAVAPSEVPREFFLTCEDGEAPETFTFCMQGALIEDNHAETLVGGEDFVGEGRILTAMGGGIFMGGNINVRGSAAVKYSKISGNTATIASTSVPNGTLSEGAETVIYASGGGVGIGAFGLGGLYNTTPTFFDSADEAEDGSPDADKYSELFAVASVISGNTVDISPPDNVGDTTSQLTASGGGVSGYATNDFGGFAVASLLSVVKENTVRTGEHLESANAVLHGGGIAAQSGGVLRAVLFEGEGALALGPPIGDVSNVYIGKYSGNEDNTIIASPHEDTIAVGGGVSSQSAIVGSAKRAFDNLPDSGGYLAEIAGASGAIVGNSIDVQAATSINAVGGGGVATILTNQSGDNTPFGNGFNTPFKYTSITDNHITVTGTSVDFTVAGGGALSVRSDLPGFEIQEEEYSNVVGTVVARNSISISDADGDAGGVVAGGGLARAGGRPYSALYIDRSSIVENDISIAGSSTPNLAVGGGGASFLGSNVEIYNATVANNGITHTHEEGEAYAAGLAFIDTDSDIIHTTIAGNTVAAATPANRGVQLNFEAASGALINTLISGVDLGEGADCYIDDSEDSVTIDGVAISNPGNCAPDLDSSVADPQYLDTLEFNGFAFEFNGFAFNEGPTKYLEMPTIALLAGSGAIDAAAGSTLSIFVDQRDYPRDDDPDLGAYEFAADGDGDGVVGERGGAGTIPGTKSVLVLLPFGDGNSDGLSDVDQPNVSTFEPAGSPQSVVTLEALGSNKQLSGLDVERVDGLNFSSYYASVDAEVLTPFSGTVTASLGSISFEAEDGGDFALIVPADAGMDQLMKLECNLPDEDAEPHWVVLDSAPEPFGPNRLRFTFTIEDDDRFDCNGEEDGIRDPLVPVALSFESPIPVPTMSTLVQVLLAGMLGLFGVVGLRRSKASSPRQS